MASPLKKHRLQNGLSLKEVGDLIRVNKSTILRWEKSEVPTDRLKELCDALGVPARVLRPDLHRFFARNERAA